ncbi:MAG: hypothetical protein RIQ79_825 [Verrucomicrobiota bacterium]
MNLKSLLFKLGSIGIILLIVLGFVSGARAQTFTHPGIPLTVTDLDAVKAKVLAGEQPWKAGYDLLVADGRSQLTYTMQGPFASVSRNPHVNRNEWMNDMQAVWNLSRMWYFTGNVAYAQKAHDILIAWANTQTEFVGTEAQLDLGDHAFRYVGGADILRGTWSGWTEADTTAVKSLFANVYWPATGLGGEVLGPGNKGGLALSAGTAIAVFCDDSTRLNKALNQLRSFPSTGFVNTLTNGEHGETGRDQGHSYGQMLAMAFTSEVLWKQGIDVFSERDNRILAMGEYYARFNLGVTTPFVPMGTTDEYYLSIWDAAGYQAEPMAFNIMKGAYVLRKGLSAPYLTAKLAAQAQNMDAFMFLKASDTSTATQPAAIVFPSASPVGAGLTNIDIGGATPVGTGTYNAGTWTVSGGGTDIWTHGAEKFHFLYKQVTGDCTMIAKVNSVQNTHASAKAGVMIRSDLNSEPLAKAWVAITPSTKVESYFDGWRSMYGGSNWEAQSYPVPRIPYWVKVERRGNLVTTYASPDGVSWATIITGTMDNLGGTAYIGLAVSSLVNGTLNTSTFTNVSVTGGTGGTVFVPEVPIAVYGSPGDGHVPLRWTESFGATSYKVKRALVTGGPYQTIATLNGTSYVDTPLTNGTTYHYVVTAANSAGESLPAPEEVVTPLATMVNVAIGGSAVASANGSSTTEGAAKAFDLNSGTKWFNGNAGTTGWLIYAFSSAGAQVITAYDLVSGSDVPGRDPMDWQFQGSSNGSTWTTLDSESGQLFLGRNFPKRYYITNTTSFRYYRLNVIANNGDATGLQLGELSLLVAVSAPPPLAAPTGLTATVVDAHRVDLAWAAVVGAGSYRVQRATVAGGPYTTVAANVAATSYSDAALTSGSIYYYVISAMSEGSESVNSNEVFAIPVSYAIGINFRGGSTGNGTPATLGTAELAGVVASTNWNNASGASGSLLSLLERSGGTTTAGVSWVANNIWSISITDAGGNSRLMKGYLDTSATSTTTVTVTGLPAAITANGYDVYVYCDGDNGTSTKTGRYSIGTQLITATDGPSVNFSGAFSRAANSSGNYVVFANQTGSSFTLTSTGTSTDTGPRAPINGIQIVALTPAPLPAAPTSFAAITNSASQINLSWGAVSGATSYTLLRGSVSGGPYTPVSSGLSLLVHADIGLTPGATYYYVITATGAAGTSGFSAQVSATTLTALQAWRVGYFGAVAATGDAAATADPDGDGATNLLEYALGTSPVDSASIAPPILGLDGLGHLTLAFNLIADSTLTYQVQATDDLAATPWPEVLWSSSGVGNLAGPIVVTDPQVVSGHLRRFLRLSVSTNP